MSTERGLGVGGVFQKSISSIKEAFYETLYLCSKKPGVATWWFYITVIIDFFQLVAFPIRHTILVQEGENNGIQEAYTSFLSWTGLTDDAVETVGPNLWIAMYAVTTAWTFTFLTLIFLICYRFCANVAQGAFSLKLLRSMAMLSSTVLFLPFVSILLQTFQCTNGSTEMAGWKVRPNWACFGAAHITMTVIMAIVLPCFILVSVFIAAVFFERDVRSKFANAQVHGRGDMLMLVNKILLSLLFGVFTSWNPWILQLFLFGSSLSFLYVYTMDMPYLSFRGNEVRCGTASGFFFVCLVPFHVLIDPGHPVGAFIVIALVVGPAVGVMLCRIRHTAIPMKPLQSLYSCSELSIWARKRIQIYERLKNLYEQSSDNVTIETVPAYWQIKEQSEIPSTEPSLLELGDKGILYYRYQSLIDQVENAYRILIGKYPHKGRALLEASTFFRCYHDNLYMEMLTLSKAQRYCSSIDIQFVVYQRLKQLRERDITQQRNASKSSMNAVDRVLFDQKWKTATSEETNVHKYVYQLWQALMSECPDLAQMQKYAQRFTESMETANEHYQECLCLNSNSTKALRAYGRFLKEMKGDADKASEYLNKAERIEDSNSRNKPDKMDRFTVYDQSCDIERNDESSGVIIISGDPSHIGEILEVNAAASNLFARSKTELIGSNVSTIIPSPFSKLHDLYLKRFAKTGKSFVINKTRALFGKTGSNELIPLIMHFREVPPDPQHTVTAPRFSAVMHCPKTSENFLLFDNESNNFMILHADSRTHSMFLGIDPSQLEHLEVSLSYYLPQLLGGTQSRRSEQKCESQRSEVDGTTPKLYSTLVDHSRNKGQLDHEGPLCTRSPSSGKVSSEDLTDVDSEESSAHNAEVFLASLEDQTGYSQISTINTQDPRSSTILARVQSIPVTDYGTIYLLVWKPEGKKTTCSPKNVDATKPFKVSQSSSCPLSKEIMTTRTTKILSTPTHLPGQSSEINRSPHDPAEPETFTFSKTSQEKQVNDAEFGKPSRRAAVGAGCSLHPPVTEATTPQCLETKGENGVESQQSSLQSQQESSPTPTTGCINGTLVNYKEHESGKGKTGSVCTGSSSKSGTSAMGLLRYMIKNGISGVEDGLQQVRVLMALLLLCFIAAAIASSVELDNMYGNTFNACIGVETAGSERIFFSGTQSHILQLFVAKSPYQSTAVDKSDLWPGFQFWTDNVIHTTLRSLSRSRSIKGSAHKWSLESRFQIKEQLQQQHSKVSFNQIQEFIVSHMRQIQGSLQNISDLNPENPPNSMRLLLKNSGNVKRAMERSLDERANQFISMKTSSQSALFLFTFMLLGFICVVVLALAFNSLFKVDRRRKEFLKTFLLISPKVVKRLRHQAGMSFLENLESVKKIELAETVKDSAANVTFSSSCDSEDEDEMNLTDMSYEKVEDRYKIEHQEFSPSRRVSQASQVLPEGGIPEEAKYRRHKDSDKAFLTLWGQISSPLAILLMWSIAMSLNVSFTLDNLEKEVQRIRVTGLVFNDLFSYQQEINCFALRISHPRIVVGNASQAQLREFRDNATTLQHSVLESATMVIEGGNVGSRSLSSLSSSTNLHNVWLEDGCSPLSQEYQSRCQSTRLKNGLNSFLRDIFVKGNEIIEELPEISESNGEAMEDILDPDMESKLQEFNSLFYPLPLEVMSWIMDKALSTGSEEISTSLQAHRIITAISVALFAMLAALVSIPVMKKLTQTLVASVNVLVLIPNFAIASNQALRHQVKTITHKLTSSRKNKDDEAAVISMLNNINQ